MKKIVLHVGMHKTASSSIQSTLANNLDLLDSQGAHFPIFKLGKRNIDNHSIPLYSLFCETPDKYHINVRFSVDIPAQHALYKEQLDTMLAKKDFIILSGEDVCILSESGLKSLKDYLTSFGHELEVHCVLRQPYSLLCSLIQQNIKGGLESLNNIHIVAISSMVEKLMLVFGDVRFHAFSKLKSSSAGLVREFLSLANIDTSNFRIINSNEGIGDQTTRLLNYVNQRVPVFVDGKLNSLRCGVHQFNSDFNCDNRKFYLTDSELSTVQKDLEDENKALDLLLKCEDFLDVDFPVNKHSSVSEDFLKAVIIKSKSLPKAMKRACYDYLNSTTQENSLSHLLDDFFQDDLANLNADLARNTALLWESRNINNAMFFMTLAKYQRPKGELILKKLSEYQKIIEQRVSDEK
ncbi:hypothetical protein C7Y69_03270 [Alteromonas sp. KS69]|uniref:hypothetical protein n=1 Tax=Alteromonas sp. KS69 TaxID=2109917 RepID=UPI000F873336|nr:hypothetical protein [Alteromonas sp. KS69]RUP83086.1 hypothetical protein C7Y69_03270 [Alteromonas sp. KS69]|tara:strand:+ start:4183 stop:5406 length:1224 start_codon:yes stop_codon:yes gene_type:complete